MYILKILDSSLFFFMYMSMNFFILFAFISTFHALLLASNCVTEKCFQKPSNMARLICLLHKNAKCTCNYIQNDMFAYFSSCQCVYNTAFAFLCSVYMFFVRCILNFFSFFHMSIEPVFILTHCTAYPMYVPMLPSKFMYVVERFINLVIFDTND